jgi:hypothetical protein
MRSHKKLNFFTGGHDTSTAMSCLGKLNIFTGGNVLVLQRVAMDNYCFS